MSFKSVEYQNECVIADKSLSWSFHVKRIADCIQNYI